MPKGYIIRYIFTPPHESLLLKKNEEIIGGIVFVTYKDIWSTELTFLAI